jgi:hypothetical protein
MSVIKKSSVLVVVFLGMFVGSARAQETVVANVPFPFFVQSDQLPAGRYEVRIDGGVLYVRRADTGAGVFAVTFRAGGGDPAGDKPSLVFTHHDSDYVLSQVWESRSDGLVVVEPAVRERHAEARPLPSDGSIVVVAANWK